MPPKTPVWVGMAIGTIEFKVIVRKTQLVSRRVISTGCTPDFVTGSLPRNRTIADYALPCRAPADAHLAPHRSGVLAENAPRWRAPGDVNTSSLEGSCKEERLRLREEPLLTHPAGPSIGV